MEDRMVHLEHKKIKEIPFCSAFDQKNTRKYFKQINLFIVLKVLFRGLFVDGGPFNCNQKTIKIPKLPTVRDVTHQTLTISKKFSFIIEKGTKLFFHFGCVFIFETT
jgi:hypothetical protein